MPVNGGAFPVSTAYSRSVSISLQVKEKYSDLFDAFEITYKAHQSKLVEQLRIEPTSSCLQNYRKYVSINKKSAKSKCTTDPPERVHEVPVPPRSWAERRSQLWRSTQTCEVYKRGPHSLQAARPSCRGVRDKIQVVKRDRSSARSRRIERKEAGYPWKGKARDEGMKSR